MNKRFIAGAICPSCAALDRLVIFLNEDGVTVRECVACGFTDTQNESQHGNPQSQELKTRVYTPLIPLRDLGE